MKLRERRSESMRVNLRGGGTFLVAVTVAGLLVAPAMSSASPSASASLVKSGDLARDCLGQAMLDGDHPRVIRFVLWCGVQSGEARFSLRRAEGGGSQSGAPILSFSAHPDTTGPGADRSFRCRRRVESLRCTGRKSRQLVVRGRIVVAAGTRCAVPIRLRAAEADYQGVPSGCPGTHRERANFGMDYMRDFRAQLGLDEDLKGNRSAIDRRIRGIVRAWRRGEPVARVSAIQYGQPFRPADQRRLEFRDELLERTADALERWVPKHAADSYAGYELDDQHGAIFYIGFTGDQDAQLAAFKRQVKLFAPEHIKPFPVPPLYSERELAQFEEEVWEPFGSELSQLIVSTGIVSLPNKVEVGTQHVAKVKQLLADRFGPDAPFLVVFERPGVFL